MAKNIKERQRKINVDAMTPEQQEQVGVEMGKKVGEICEAAKVELNEKLNKITGMYGLEAVIQIAFKDKDGNILT